MTRRRQELISSLGAAVQAYQRSTDAFDDAVAGRLELNRTDLRCLDHLFEGPRTAGQLGEATGLSSAATTTLLDRLEKRGLVRRVRDVADRRKVLVEMTDRSGELVGRLYGPLVTEGNARLRKYSDAELALLHGHFRMITELTEANLARVRAQPLDLEERRPAPRK
jgi:DNA-binding MarR family transcriptional regulator